MRIAPRPMAGQEVSIDDLLQKPRRVVWGDDTTEEAFGPVRTGQGEVWIKLASESSSITTRKLLYKQLQEEKSPWRIVSGDELYALMELLYGSKDYDSLTHMLLKECFASEPILLLSTVGVGRDQKWFVTQRNDSPLEQKQRFSITDFQFSPFRTCEAIFGSQDWDYFQVVWQHFAGERPKLIHYDDPTGSGLAVYQPLIYRNEIQFHRYPTEPQGVGLFVQTKVVTP